MVGIAPLCCSQALNGAKTLTLYLNWHTLSNTSPPPLTSFASPPPAGRRPAPAATRPTTGCLGRLPPRRAPLTSVRAPALPAQPPDCSPRTYGAQPAAVLRGADLQIARL